jgi:RND family efflux transporter MFP subunit
MQRKSIATAVATLAAAGLLAATGALLAQGKDGKPAAAAAAAPAGALATAPVALRDVADVYAADATIEAVRQATVSAQINGTVTQFYVDAGDRVKRGQLLARIDTRETDAQVNAGRAGVAQAEAGLSQAKLNYDRTQSLIKQGFVSQAALDKADADLKAAQAAVEVARAGSTQAVTARSFAELRAPIDGVVSQRLMELGELATAGKPVLMLHDPAQLRAVGAVPQFVLPKVAGVKTAQVELPTLGKTLAATRVTVLPAADARLLSTLVRADLGADAPPGVVPGTAAKVLLPTGTARKLVMPAAAVLRRGELTAAYVVGADGRPQLRQIRVGERVTASSRAPDGNADGLVEVLAGLADGERVALDPLAASGRVR